MKKRINISMDFDTEERLRQYAWETHSSVSKAVSDLVWAAKVKNESIRGQTNLMELAASNAQSKKKKVSRKRVVPDK